MHFSVIHSPSISPSKKFDVGILLPAYREWITPFYCLRAWLSAIDILEKKYRILILILVNWPSSTIPWNQETLKLWAILTDIVDSRMNSASDTNEEAQDLFNLIGLQVHKNSDRIKIVLWSYHHPKNTIWMARHRWCSYLKKNSSSSWIIISTDSDSKPSSTDYLKDAMVLFEDNLDIWWATGGFICTLDGNDDSDRTRQLYTYLSICSSLYAILISHSFFNEKMNDVSNLTLMPGSNTIFRAWLYGYIACFSDDRWTGEDTDFSRRILEAEMPIIHDPSLSIDTLYRPSDRTVYGLWTEINAVNTAKKFSVTHPEVKIWHLSVHQIFDHVSDFEVDGTNTKSNYLIQCLKNQFGDDIMDIGTSEKLRIEIESGKWLLVGQVRLNDAAIRIVNDRLESYYWRLSGEEAYEWIVQFLKERLSPVKKNNRSIFLHSMFVDELEKMRRFDVSIWNYEVFLKNILQKIQAVLSWTNPNEYENISVRLIPSP